METKEFYVTIDGQQIPVTEEVYRAYMRPVWAEQKRQEREKRCRVDGVRCMEDCSRCPHQRTGSVVSLDQLAEDGFLPADRQADIEEIIAGRIMLEDLFRALEELDPDGRLMCELFGQGMSEREMTKVFGVSRPVIHKRLTRLFEHLRKILEK